MNSVSRIDRFILQIKGNFEGNLLSIFVSKQIDLLDAPTEMLNRSVAFLKKESEEKYTLSLTVSALPGHIETNAFSDLLTARRDNSSKKPKIGRDGRGDQKQVDQRRNRANEEEFLALVANHELVGREVLPVPIHLKSRLRAIIESKGGVLEWARSHPEYIYIRAREQSKLRRAAKIRRRIREKRKKVAATRWKTKSRRK